MMQTTLHCLQGLQNLCLSFAAMFFVSWKPLRITRIKVNAGIPASPTVGYTGKAWQQPLWRPSTESEPAFSKSVAIFSLLTFSPKKSKHRESKTFFIALKISSEQKKLTFWKTEMLTFQISSVQIFYAKFLWLIGSLIFLGWLIGYSTTGKIKFGWSKVYSTWPKVLNSSDWITCEVLSARLEPLTFSNPKGC